LQPPRASAASRTDAGRDAVLNRDRNIDIFRIANSAKGAELEFHRLNCPFVSTHAGKDNQWEWIVVGCGA
jgi:hypothetical protein